MIIIKTGLDEHQLAQETNKDKPGIYRINQYLHRYDKQKTKSMLDRLLKEEGIDYSLYYNND